MNVINIDQDPTQFERLPELREGESYWHFNQNNSGGYFTPPAENVFVQAESKEVAYTRLSSLPGFTEAYCWCCGERWSTWMDESYSLEDMKTRYREMLEWRWSGSGKDGVPHTIVVVL